MASFIPNLAAWPFPLGESPFAIKGTAYRGHIEYVERHFPGGVAGMLECFSDPELRAFFAQPFLASTSYDLMPLVLAAAPCGEKMGMSAAEFAAVRARDQAPKDLGGVYRFLLAMVPTGTVARRLPQLLTQVFNFGATTMSTTEPGHIEASIENIPEALAPWMCVIISAYGDSALRTSGARDALFTMKPGPYTGTEKGVRLVRCPVDIRYV